MIVHLNGEYLEKIYASVSVDDRGFYFADGVYEVIRFYKGQSFDMESHLVRLKNSLNEIRLNYENIGQIPEICHELICMNHLKSKHASIYIQITRGIAPRVHHIPKEKLKPTFFASAHEFNPLRNELENGVSIISGEDIRWTRCDIKSIGLLPNTLSIQSAYEKNAHEFLFVRNGMITEASHSNFFAKIEGKFYTAPLSNYILAGVTRKNVLNVCKKIGIEVFEKYISVDDIAKIEEAFLSSTREEVMPVIKIDDFEIGNGKPGEQTLRIQKEFFAITYDRYGGM